ncbi:MAG: endonuclease/exonuclease/phosphatase family protein [Ginsengibacter sp.]
MTIGSKFLKNCMVFINICLIACYLPVCIIPFINTARHWYIALPGLIFPITCLGLIFFILIWAFLRSRWCWISVAVLLLGTQQIVSVFGFHLPKTFESTKNENTLRILQWNVTSWNELKKKRGSIGFRPDMLELVKEQKADILCFEEFFETRDTKYFPGNIPAIAQMGYPYHYYVPTITWYRDFETGVVIFSKYPIIDSLKISFEETTLAEHLIYIDIKVKEKIFRVLTTHLQSVKFDEDDYESLSQLKHINKEGLKDSRTIVSKLKKGYTHRYLQAEMVRQEIEKSPYPVILCGDFNDVPNSSTYFRIKGKLQDCFLKKGSFLGRTFRFISPTLRIDYILADKKFTVEQFQRIRVPYSDHYPVEADLAW